MKWIDRRIAKKMEVPLKLIKFYKIFLQVLECVITFDLFQWHFHVFCTLPSIRFRGTSSFRFCDTWSVHLSTGTSSTYVWGMLSVHSY